MDVLQRKHLYTPGKNVNTNSMENSTEISQRIKVDLPIDLAIPLPGLTIQVKYKPKGFVISRFVLQ